MLEDEELNLYELVFLKGVSYYLSSPSEDGEDAFSKE